MVKKLPEQQIDFNQYIEQTPNSKGKQLNLAGRQLSNKDIKSIGKFIEQHKDITGLNLSSNQFGSHHFDFGIHDCAINVFVPEKNSLITIHLYNNALRNSDVSRLCNAINNSSCTSSLKKLSISNNKIGNEGAAKLAGIIKECKELESLYIHNNRIKDAGAKVLASSLKGSNLRILDIGGNKLTDDGIEDIAKGVSGSSLEELYLDFCTIGAKGAQAIADMLQSENKLTYLSLQVCNLDEKNLFTVSQAVAQSSKLKHLDLGGIKLTERVIDELVKNKSLDVLSLRECRIGDIGLTKIISNEFFSQLQLISLIGNGISEQGADVLLKRYKEDHKTTPKVMLDFNPIPPKKIIDIHNLSVGVSQSIAVQPTDVTPTMLDPIEIENKKQALMNEYQLSLNSIQMQLNQIDEQRVDILMEYLKSDKGKLGQGYEDPRMIELERQQAILNNKMITLNITYQQHIALMDSSSQQLKVFYDQLLTRLLSKYITRLVYIADTFQRKPTNGEMGLQYTTMVLTSGLGIAAALVGLGGPPGLIAGASLAAASSLVAIAGGLCSYVLTAYNDEQKLAYYRDTLVYFIGGLDAVDQQMIVLAATVTQLYQLQIKRCSEKGAKQLAEAWADIFDYLIFPTDPNKFMEKMNAIKIEPSHEQSQYTTEYIAYELFHIKPGVCYLVQQENGLKKVEYLSSQKFAPNQARDYGYIFFESKELALSYAKNHIAEEYQILETPANSIDMELFSYSQYITQQTIDYKINSLVYQLTKAYERIGNLELENTNLKDKVQELTTNMPAMISEEINKQLRQQKTNEQRVESNQSNSVNQNPRSPGLFNNNNL